MYDLLPITHPNLFPPWARAMHESWIAAIVRAGDFLACISCHTKYELTKWMDRAHIAFPSRPSMRVFCLGADIGASLPTKGLPADAGTIFDAISRRMTFLMVGTIEPRKGHLRTLGAFGKLWRRGVDVNLVVVGREGWRGLPDSDRRTIPKIVAALRNDAEAGKRLFWLEGVSDEYLQEIYDRCDCLIAASDDEGFGLPLIEAAKHGIPVLARDIPVFREIGTDYAEFFPADSGQGIQRAVEGFVARRSRSGKESRDRKGWISWGESARTLLSFVKDSQRPSMGIERSLPLVPSNSVI